MTVATVVCPQCSTPVGGSSEFCPVCGDFLGWRDEPTVVVHLPDAGDVPEQRPDAVDDDPLRRYREEAVQAQADAEAAQEEAARAQVRLERARRRSASARRRVERLEAELPGAQQRAEEAVRAAERAAAGVRRAASAARGAAAARRPALRERAEAARAAEEQARAASLQAQESAATLAGTLEGARAEVATSPAEVRAAQTVRDAARAAASAATGRATAAAAELALQERLLRLRATPRRVVGLPEEEQQALRDEAEREAQEAARDAGRRAGAAERRERRRAQREDDERTAAEEQADQHQLGVVLEVADEAERAARTAERAARAPRGEDGGATLAGVQRSTRAPREEDDAPVDREEPGAVSPIEVRRRVRRRAVPLVAPDDGPVLCPDCATGNAEGRHLCRSCGQLLHPPAPPPPPPPLTWWQRWWAWCRRALGLGPRERVFIPAGARPVPGGNAATAAAVRRATVDGLSGDRLRRLGPLLVAAVVLLGVLAALVLVPLDRLLDGRRDVVDRVRFTAVPVLSTRASTTRPPSAAALAVDGDPVTAWTPRRVPGVGDRLGIRLAATAEVVAVRVTSAAGTGRPRPSVVTVHALGHLPVVLRLEDTTRPQRLALPGLRTDDVRLRIDGVHPGSGGTLPAGFAEVELLTRQVLKGL